MALNKVTYVDNVTVIGAQNLNDIQDEVIKNGDSIGSIINLDTEATDLVDAVNEVNNKTGSATQNIGTLSGLTTDAKGTLVAAINEVDGHADSANTSIGTLSGLHTDAKNNLVNAINEVDGHADTANSSIGTLSGLTTDSKSTLVSAINEVNNHADSANTAIGTLTNLTTNEKTNLVGAVNEVNEVTSDLKEAIKKTSDMNLNLLFEVGNIGITSAGWGYWSYASRVRTIEGTTLSVKKGDTIGLTDYSNARYYIGYRTNDNIYHMAGWLTQDVQFQEDAECVVVISNLTEVPISSCEELSNLFFWEYAGLGKYISQNMGDINQLKKIPYKTFPGYITITGAYGGAGTTTLEVYTNKIECRQGDRFVVDLKATSTDSQWGVYALYDENLNFISRTSMWDGSNISAYRFIVDISNASAKYIAFSMRTYGTNELDIYAPRLLNLASGIIEARQNRISTAPLLITGAGGFPSIDTVAKTITFPEDILLLYRGDTGIVNDNKFIRITSENTVVSFGSINSTAIKVVYNLTTNTLSARYFLDTITENEIIICSLRHGTGYAFASMSCPYYVDGFLFGNDSTADINPNVKSINHRGYNVIAPENTLPAFKLSKKRGFEMVETDVLFTSDRVPVCLHDATINRTARQANGDELTESIRIDNITYAEALTYDFGIWKGSAYAGTKIPTFEEFVVLCKNIGLHPYIEIKAAFSENEIRGLVDTVASCGMQGNVTWISFTSTLLEYVKNYDAKARIGYVVNSVTSAVITTANTLKTDDNEVFIDSGSVTAEEIALCVNARLPLEVWTYDSESSITALDKYVSGVTSDNLVAGAVMYKANIL